MTEWNGIQAEMIAGLLMKKSASPNATIFKAVNRWKHEAPEEHAEEEKTDKERALEIAKKARGEFFASLASVFLGADLVAEFQVAAETTINKKQGVAARLKERRKMDEAKEVSRLPPSTITVLAKGGTIPSCLTDVLHRDRDWQASLGASFRRPRSLLCWGAARRMLMGLGHL